VPQGWDGRVPRTTFCLRFRHRRLHRPQIHAPNTLALATLGPSGSGPPHHRVRHGRVHGASPVHAEEVVSFDEYNRPPEPHLHLDCIHGERKERSLREARRLDRERGRSSSSPTAGSAQPRSHCIVGLAWDATARSIAREKRMEVEGALHLTRDKIKLCSINILGPPSKKGTSFDRLSPLTIK
jgi:hypothetical protein